MQRARVQADLAAPRSVSAAGMFLGLFSSCESPSDILKQLTTCFILCLHYIILETKAGFVVKLEKLISFLVFLEKATWLVVFK